MIVKPDSKSMKILIVNLHSALNLGDDAIMHATLAGLRNAFPGAQIIAAANHPQSWEKFADLEVVGSFVTWAYRLQDSRWRGQRWLIPLILLGLPLIALTYRVLGLQILAGNEQKRRLLSAYYSADLVLSCGGGNFYAHKRLSSFLLLALSALVFPTWLGKRTIMLPQSVGPIDGGLQRWLARYVFNRVDLLLLREERSVKFVQDVLHVRSPLSQLPDLAFGLVCNAGPDPDPGHEALRIGINVIDRAAQQADFAGQQQYESSLIELCARLAADNAIDLTIFCQVYGPTLDQDDLRAARRLHAALCERNIAVTLQANFTDARETIAAYAHLDLMIGSRMHAGIFALLCGVPTLLIAYQPKALGMMTALGLAPHCLDIDMVNPDALINGANSLLQQRTAIREAARMGVMETRQQLQGWEKLLRN